MDPSAQIDAASALWGLFEAMALTAVGAIIGGKLWLLVRH